jgi:ABC-type Fe3+-hydroxamate transport system substrate-binding protein
LRRLVVLAVFFLLVLGLFLVYRFLVGGGRVPVEAPVNVSVATSTGNVSVVDSDGDGIPDDAERVYGTDPYRPNYLFAYALGRLPVGGGSPLQER